MKPPYGMTVVPYGWPLMADAWAAHLQFLIGEDECREQFARETGIKLERLINRSPIDAMIDRATGAETKSIAAFCDWATRKFWGVEK